MKRAVIVHCWSGVPDSRWYPSSKKELEALGFEVRVPAMPDTEHPNLEYWLPLLRGIVGEPDKDLFLIGHSVGCATILRYLELLGEDQKVGGVVLVAGFTDDLEGIADITDELKSFFQEPLDYKTIKSKSDHFVAIHSDDDPYVDLKYGYIFKEKLRAQVVIKHGMGHFSEPDGGGDKKVIKELPDVARAITRMVKN